jgi:uncharacterized protein YdhG (YjbR/CyaY superfamily)
MALSSVITAVQVVTVDDRAIPIGNNAATMSSRSPVRLANWPRRREGGVMTSEDIDRCLARVEEPKRATLEEMRRRILEVIPDAEQCISYAVPAFKVQGKTVAGLAAFKNHLSYLPHSGSVLTALAAETRVCPQTSGSLHFPIDTPLPRPLIKKLLAMRMRQAGLHPA